MTTPVQDDSIFESKILDLRDVPISSLRSNHGIDVEANTRRVIARDEESPRSRKPGVAAFNSFI